MTDAPLPLVSVGIPAYNAANTVERSVRSILDQTYQNIEIVVFDNGSTDTTEQVCRRLARADTRIRYIRSPSNQGTSFSFNQAFLNTTGEYFMWSAADDLRDPNDIASGVRLLEEDPSIVASVPITLGYIEDEDELIYSVEVTGIDIGDRGVKRLHTIFTNFPTTALYSLFRSSSLKSSGLLRSSVASDVALLQELAANGAFRSNPDQVLRFVRRKNWNTREQDFTVFTGRDYLPRVYVPGLVLLRERLGRYWSMDKSFRWRIFATIMLIGLETRRAAFKISLRQVRRLIGKTNYCTLVEWGYWRFFHKENYLVFDKKRYIERMILPQYGVR